MSGKEFKAFPKIERIGKVFMCITQKIHGTNAQITIEEVTVNQPVEASGVGHFVDDEQGGKQYALYVGCRTRWITREEDNFGFARFVYENKAELIEKLGPGTHFGEWAGPGINSGEGLTQKTFVLFDHWRYPPERPLPPQTVVVPVLYKGPIDATKIDEVMADLKANGSKLALGFMRPEGVVIQISGERYKKVFEAEDTQWRKGDGNKDRVRAMAQEDYSHLLQPIRLEKLLSRDESYVREFPESLPRIVKEYFADLEAEGEVKGEPDELKAIRKGASSLIFHFVRTTMENNEALSFKV